MTIKPSIFKAYDIRGIYPEEINETNFSQIIKAIYVFYKKTLRKDKLKIVVGRDMRLSSPQLHKIAVKTLVDLGNEVIDIGLATTPTVYYAVLKYQTDAGIQVSASHNPSQYNGVKFVYRKGNQLVKVSAITGMEEVKEIALKNNFQFKEKKGKLIIKTDTLTTEINDAIKELKVNSLKKLKIVADPGNAMGSLYIQAICKKFGINLVKMNFELDGSFPSHQPNPLLFHLLEPLQKRVIKEKADLGMAPDGDGDRIFFITEKGEIVPATIITSFLAKEILAEKPGRKILVDVRDTKNVFNTCKKYGGVAILSKVGHALITEQLNRVKAVFAGESSGHYYFEETGGAESSIRVILYLLRKLSMSNLPLSKLLEPFQTAIESGEYNFVLDKSITGKQVMEIISKEYSDGKLSQLDGIAVDYPSWRFNIRTSNTEPLLRLNVEANTDKLVKTKLKELTDKILKLGAKRKI